MKSVVVVVFLYLFSFGGGEQDNAGGEGGGASSELSSPVRGSAGRSDSLLLEDREDLTGTGKNPRRKRATPTASHIRMNVANTDERTFMLPSDGYFKREKVE